MIKKHTHSFNEIINLISTNKNIRIYPLTSSLTNDEVYFTNKNFFISNIFILTISDTNLTSFEHKFKIIGLEGSAIICIESSNIINEKNISISIDQYNYLISSLEDKFHHTIDELTCNIISYHKHSDEYDER